MRDLSILWQSAIQKHPCMTVITLGYSSQHAHDCARSGTVVPPVSGEVIKVCISTSVREAMATWVTMVLASLLRSISFAMTAYPHHSPRAQLHE